MQELISIVVPVYNGERYLCENVESILNQTYRNLEIIYICDGCTDRTVDILQKYSSDDPRLKVHVERINNGAAISRNTGLKMAKGDWIIFLDSDDLFETDMIETMLIGAIQENADMCCCFIECFQKTISCDMQLPNGSMKLYCKTYPYIYVSNERKYILQIVSNSSCSKLVHRTVYEKKEVFFPKLPNCEDIYYSSVVAMEAEKIVYVNRILLHYRSNIGRDTLTARQMNVRNCAWEACDQLYQYICQKDHSDELKQSFYNRVCEYIHDYAGSATYSEFLSVLKDVYLKKWGMDSLDIIEQLSYFNREIYKQVCSGCLLLDKYLLCKQAKVNFVKDKANEKGCSVWGCGHKGIELLEELGINFAGIQHLYDSDCNKWGRRLYGYIVEEFDTDWVENVIVTTMEHFDEIKQQIGNKAHNIYNLEKEIYLY